jgi:GTP pyrophosphokinase
VIDLPINSTPIDFAYAIHSDIGDHTFGAKINGKFAPLDMALKNGDRVEILTKKGSKPSPKWVTMAKTTLARRHIRTALQKEKEAFK